MISLANWTIFYKIKFFTVKFRKDLWSKLELKLSPPLKSVAAYPAKSKVFNYAASQHI